MSKEIFDEAIFDDLTYYFKSNCIRIRFHNFENVIKRSEKIKSGDKNPEEAKRLQNVLNQISTK